MGNFLRGQRLFSRPSRGGWVLDADYPGAMKDAMDYAKSRKGIPVVRKIANGSDKMFDASRDKLAYDQKGRNPMHTSARGTPQGRLSSRDIARSKIAWKPTLAMNAPKIISGIGGLGMMLHPTEMGDGTLRPDEILKAKTPFTGYEVNSEVEAPVEAPVEVSKENQVLELLSKYFPSKAVPALMGNISVETGDTFDFTQKEKGGKGYGLVQLTGKQLTSYNDWLRDNEGVDSAESQIKYLANLINSDNPYYDIGHGNRKILKGLMNSDTVDTASLTEEIMNRYERPKKGQGHLDRRVSASMRYDN